MQKCNQQFSGIL